jgi:argininosuccinate synthase
MSLDALKNEKTGLCVSGGLDSRTVATRLLDGGVDLLCFTADLAQPDENDISGVADKMAECGTDTVVVDLKEEMARACLQMVKAQARYDGGYWNSTGIARAVTVRGLVDRMRELGCTVLAHGATGRGNDQMRFERYTNALAPDMKVYAPWRDPELLQQFAGRAQMVQYLKDKGIEASQGEKKRYSTDANLAGISYEAEDLEHLNTPCTIVELQMGVWPEQAPDEPEEFSVRFKKGQPEAVNGRSLDPLALMKEVNRIGGRNGIGIKNALENRIIGTKSRGVYEAPGMELLGVCLRQVYMAVMGRRATDLFAHLSSFIARQVYDGRYFDAATTAALAAVDELAAYASGLVKVSLYKGNIHFMELSDCDGSLYNEEDASMEASEGLNPRSSQGFAEVQSVEARAMARAGQIRD